MFQYLPDNGRGAVWQGDICKEDVMREIGLLTHDIKLVWSPPRDTKHTQGRKLVLTAVGQGKPNRKIFVIHLGNMRTITSTVTFYFCICPTYISY